MDAYGGDVGVEPRQDYSQFRVIKILPSEDDRWKVVQRLDGSE